ncbi:unnamed protein product [Symbiodinium natans]|uniref:Actin n=1 Tax=Symbiodinium natans TaxID=878477 RepID=A0A812UE73_9DINO|nr:unnamed protein product [Symbiodinium natans]
MAGTPLVLDNGSGSVKVGYAGQQEPQVVYDNMYTAVRSSRHEPSKATSEALEKSNARLHVMDHGIVSQWEGLVEVFKAALDEMKVVDPSQHPCLVTEAPLNPTVHRELLVEKLFEELRVPAVQVVHSGALALYAINRRTGLVIEVGDGVAQTVPLFDSYVVFNAVQRRDFGGRDLTAYLGELLQKELGYKEALADEVWWTQLQTVKERMCRVTPQASPSRISRQDPVQQEYKLPDGKVLDWEQGLLSQCAEALFQPGQHLKLDEEAEGIHKMAASSVLGCGLDIQKSLANNVVLSGGSTLFPGMCQRVQEELQRLLPSAVKAKVTRVSKPTYAAFMGGSILASMSDLQKTFMTRGEYLEYGASFIHNKSVSLTKPHMMS